MSDKGELFREIDKLRAEISVLKKHNEELQRYNLGLAMSEFTLKAEIESLKSTKGILL